MEAKAASWRPPMLAEERHELRHLLLPLHNQEAITKKSAVLHRHTATVSRADIVTVRMGLHVLTFKCSTAKY